MSEAVPLTKTMLLESRDFVAESWREDGGLFHVQPVDYQSVEVERWWLEHRFDNNRTAFRAGDEYHLECADEAEAFDLVMALQRDLNRSLRADP